MSATEGSALSAAALRRLFWTALAATVAFRLWLAWWFPMTGDEAYFVYWADAPAAGFYDHPPMVGWLLAALGPLSHVKLVMRLPSVVLPAIIAVGMAGLVRALARPAADGGAEMLGYAAALAWLVAPAQVLNIAITTDTPLAFFSFLSLAAFALGVQRRSRALVFAAGVALGLAFLSKYFAVLLGFAYLVFTLAVRREGRWRDLAIVAAAALPFALFNAWWNYQNCWANLLHNAYNRDTGFVWYSALVFAALVVYLSSPLLLWQLARNPGTVRAAARAPAVAALAACAFAPLVVLAAASIGKRIGLHWLLSFMPALFMVGALALGARRTLASAKFLAVFSAVHVLLVLVVAALPTEALQRLRKYDSIVMAMHPGELLAALKPYEGKFVFAADGYSPAVTLSYRAAEIGFVAQPAAAEPWRRHYFPVFGPGSSHGRQDDILTDFRQFDGKDILVVRKDPPDPKDYAPFFRAVQYREVTVRGATFHLVLGEHFDYSAYRDRVLALVRDRYYRIPAYLPQGRCYFCERHFGTATCPPPG